jgi:AAA domain, putative AbiEii toxin, Type IV TA system
MEHIKDFTVHRFRGLRDLKIENLGQINLFVGNNNSGKTSALEAFSVFSDPLYWRKWYDTASQREAAGTSVIDRLMWVFPWGTNDTSEVSLEGNEILLSAAGNFSVERVSASYEKFAEMMTIPKSSALRLEDAIIEEREIEGLKIHISVSTKQLQLPLFKEDVNAPFKQTLIFSDYPPISPSNSRKQGIFRLPNQIVTPLSHRTSRLTSQLWSEAVEADLKSETIKLLRFFDPAIQDVDLISPTESRQLISIKHERLGRAPLYTFGDGLRRVFMLATTIPRVKGGLLLIDELETAIHTKALEKTFDWLVKACISNDIQLLATTHSLEALDALLEASRERADLVIYRLQQDKEQTTVTRFDKEMTLRLREELGMELRY